MNQECDERSPIRQYVTTSLSGVTPWPLSTFWRSADRSGRFMR